MGNVLGNVNIYKLDLAFDEDKKLFTNLIDKYKLNGVEGLSLFLNLLRDLLYAIHQDDDIEDVHLSCYLIFKGIIDGATQIKQKMDLEK